MYMPNILTQPISTRIKLAEEAAQNYRGNKRAVLASMDTWMVFWRDAIISSKEINLNQDISVKSELLTKDDLKKLSIDIIEAVGAIRAIEKAQLALQSNGNARLIIENLYVNLPLKLA